jgi:hypothetical protein
MVKPFDEIVLAKLAYRYDRRRPKSFQLDKKETRSIAGGIGGNDAEGEREGEERRAR